MYRYDDIQLKEVPAPVKDCTGIPVPLTDETMHARKSAVLDRMAERSLDAIVIYGDLEHGSNFEYLVGFLPRFEEALLVLHQNGDAYLLLGNENLNKAARARIAATPVHVPYFSLPNQPMENQESFLELLGKTGIAGKQVGVVGWKRFTSTCEDNQKLFDLPHYIVQALIRLCGEEYLTSQSDMFIGEKGVRTVCNANELAHYEFGAALAGDCMLDAMDALKPGIREMEIADRLERYGQRTSVVTITAFGERFVKANLYPACKRLEVGDPVSLTIGYKGGLSSRAGYAVRHAGELPQNKQDYFEQVVAPYFTAIRAWLEEIHVGVRGGDLYRQIEEVLPRARYHWSLCPGHLTADEEWMASPIYSGSTEILESGMMFETDIIPSVEGYCGTSAESTIALADQTLRDQLAEQYPDLWNRILGRRTYLEQVLGIRLHGDVLPMCSTLAYLRPFLLSGKAVVVRG